MKALPVVLLALAVATAIPAWFLSSEPASVPELADRYFGVELETDDAAEAEAASLADEVGKIRIVTWGDGGPDELLVEEDDGAWRIRTRYDYPADGEEQVGETAGSLIGVAKLREVTSEERYHEELGVIDPLDDSVTVEGGRGQRATLWSASGDVLVDVIIGTYVEGASEQRYLREADDPTVYTADFSAALSSRFIDWVEPNPFDLEAAHVRSITIEDYSIDEAKGSISRRSSTEFSRSGQDADWISAQAPTGQHAKAQTVDALVTTVAGLRLADVSKRLGLGQAELVARGIFLDQQGGVYGNEGALRVTTNLGYTYHLFFGEVASSATEAADEPSDATADNDRLVAVWMTYDQSSDELLPQVPVVPLNPVGQEDDNGEALAKAKEAQKKAEEEREAHIAERTATTQRLTAKYQDYFYVIRDSDFQALRPAKEALFEPVPAEFQPPEGEDPLLQGNE